MDVACRTALCVTSPVESAAFLPSSPLSKRTPTACFAGKNVRKSVVLSSASASQFLTGGSTGTLRRAVAARKSDRLPRTSVGVRCMAQEEESGSSISTWLGRSAMLAFVGALGLEAATGKGLLETLGVTGPVPGLGLAVVAAVGGITAFGIFRSSSQD